MTNSLETIGVDAAQTLANEVKWRWRQGESPDAPAALAEHPTLAHYKPVVLDLAFEQYLIRQKTGSAPDPGVYADQFPAFRASIRNMLEAHLLLIEQPKVLDLAAGPWPELDTNFEGLDLVAELGQGAFGRAYLAFDPGTDRLCVLKLTVGNSVEARVIGRLSHPHVTEVYWSRPVGSQTAVCMPFVGVSTLADVIAKAFPPAAESPPATARVILAEAEADRLARQAARRSPPVVRPDESYVIGACAVVARIASAVAYLHEAGIVHADLKPSNVVIGPGGVPHLIDFDLATRDATTVVARGTPAYLAPEILEAARSGRSTDGIDVTRSDLFSLGVILFEILTGRLPFMPTKGPGALARLAQAVRQGPPPLPPFVPPAIVGVVAACLAPVPSDRPTSASEVATTLERFVWNERNRARRRRRRAVGIACLALLGCVAAVGVRVWPTPIATEHPPETTNEFFERGRQLLQAGQPRNAAPNFLQAHKLSGDPWALAFAAYALALDGQNGLALDKGRQAIREGAISAEVYNTVGFALSQSQHPADAIPDLDEALRLSPGMQAALYNRAIARFKSGLGQDGRVADVRCSEDVAAALAAGPTSLKLHYDAAQIFAACSHRQEALRTSALVQLREAARAGQDPARFQHDRVLSKNLSNHPEFAATCATPRGHPPDKPTQLRLVEPRP